MNSGGHHKSNAFLSCIGTKIFHALGDKESAQYGVDLIGKGLIPIYDPKIPDTNDPWLDINGESGNSVNVHHVMEDLVRSTIFISGLKTGGPPDNIVTGIVIKSGEPFQSNGMCFILAAFKQPKR